MLKDLNIHVMESYKIVINDLLTEWESINGQIVPNLIGDLYKISISCKHLVILHYIITHYFIHIKLNLYLH